MEAAPEGAVAEQPEVQQRMLDPPGAEHKQREQDETAERGERTDGEVRLPAVSLSDRP